MTRGLVAAGIVLTALNLRSAVTSLGAVLSQVRESLAMSATVAGLATALPVICFAVFGALTPALSRRLGHQRAVLVGVVAIVVGLAARVVVDDPVGFLAGSTVALAGIAVTNIMMPVLIKSYFPRSVGWMTGLYSVSITVGVALPAGVTIPLGDATGYGWRGGLGSWAVVAAFAVLPWAMLLRAERGAGHTTVQAPRPYPLAALLRSRTALCLALFFGLQSLNAYAVMGWLPAILTSAGLGADRAALLLSVSAVTAIPISFVVPRAAARSRSQNVPVFAIAAGGLAGYLGLLLAPATAPLLWAILLASLHGAFPLAVTLISLRTRDASTATQLSSFVQSGGYVLAALGPLAIGALQEATTSWTVPLIVLIGSLILELIIGLIAARPRQVEDEVEQPRVKA